MREEDNSFVAVLPRWLLDQQHYLCKKHEKLHEKIIVHQGNAINFSEVLGQNIEICIPSH